jgi:hypothetical protein
MIVNLDAHACNPSTQEAEAKDHNIKAILDYLERGKGKRNGKDRKKKKKNIL